MKGRTRREVLTLQSLAGEYLLWDVFPRAAPELNQQKLSARPAAHVSTLGAPGGRRECPDGKRPVEAAEAQAGRWGTATLNSGKETFSVLELKMTVC